VYVVKSDRIKEHALDTTDHRKWSLLIFDNFKIIHQPELAF